MVTNEVTEWFNVVCVNPFGFVALYENGDIKVHLISENAGFVNTEGTTFIPDAKLEIGHKYRAHSSGRMVLNFQRKHPEGYKPRLRMGQKYKFVNECGQVGEFTYTAAVKHLDNNYWRLLQ